jgi:hypothetical protein
MASLVLGNLSQQFNTASDSLASVISTAGVLPIEQSVLAVIIKAVFVSIMRFPVLLTIYEFQFQSLGLLFNMGMLKRYQSIPPSNERDIVQVFFGTMGKVN